MCIHIISVNRLGKAVYVCLLLLQVQEAVVVGDTYEEIVNNIVDQYKLVLLKLSYTWDIMLCLQNQIKIKSGKTCSAIIVRKNNNEKFPTSI